MTAIVVAVVATVAFDRYCSSFFSSAVVVAVVFVVNTVVVIVDVFDGCCSSCFRL